MTPPNQKTITRPADDIRIAGEALTAAIQHEARGHGAATLALIEKYADKIQANSPAARSYLLQFATETFGVFCDRLAQGFAAWARSEDGAPSPQDADAEDDGGDGADVGGDQIQCPSCETGMNRAADAGDYVCPSCWYRERR